MGVYDEIVTKFLCPFCNYEDENYKFQTKALLRNGSEYEVGNLVMTKINTDVKLQEGEIEIHTICPKCMAWISGWIKVKDKVLCKDIRYDMLESRENIPTKIVINACYGGFGLSKEAILKL